MNTFDPGDRVAYEPYDGAPLEYGSWIRDSNDPSLVFIRYDKSGATQATPRERLRKVN